MNWKKTFENTIYEFQHWVGWALTVFILGLVLTLFNVNITFFLALSIIVSVIVVDVFKHKWGLQ